ncbi:MAG: dynamin family protein, partial [Candidatus Deferrimicrobium sp.]|nr:dynamin family protein [Candidatus Deferrimicrobium sp.]
GGERMDLTHAVERVEAIRRKFGVGSLSPQLAACREMLKSGGVVDVAVLGQFKAGKSSFLNALIGGDVVPVDVLPSTAVVTRIGYGERERVTVHGLAGEPFEIPLARLAEFVTERGNPANEKRVAVVDVELPSLVPYEGVRFVDTPGLGSVFAHNTRVSRDWMPRVGAALVAVSVNHPLSEDDLLLLNDVSLHTPEAVLLLTKADLVSGEELASVIEFTRSQATSRTGKEWRILPVSNRPGFEGMRAEVAEYLRERIAGRREEAFGEIARHKVRALVSGCREYLLLAERAAEAADTARSDLIAALARERRGFGAVKAEIRLLCNHLKAEVRTAADERFHAYHGEVTGRVTANLREATAGWKGNLARVTREFEGWLADVMMEEMGTVSLHGEGHLAGFLFRAQASVERSVRAFADRLAREIERALEIRFEGARFDPQVEEPTHPDVRLSPTFDTHFELLWFLIPMPVFRPLVRRHFLRSVPWEVEKNLSRVAGQWADAVGVSIDGLFRDATEFLEREVGTIAGLVGEADTGNRGEEIRAALAELDGLESGVC